VKTGCNDATIHIELDDGKGNNRVTVIIRVINKSGQSTWSINGAPANQKQVPVLFNNNFT
jgi:chromosome segregation ATPase